MQKRKGWAVLTSEVSLGNAELMPWLPGRNPSVWSPHRLNYQAPPFIRSSSIAIPRAHTGSLHSFWTKIPIWSKANNISWETPYTKYKLVPACVDHTVSLESSSGRTWHEKEEECIGNESVWLCLVRVCEWERSPSEEANGHRCCHPASLMFLQLWLQQSQYSATLSSKCCHHL